MAWSGDARSMDKRKMEMIKWKWSVRELGGVAHISEMRIVLLGYMDAGKSSSGNTILGKQEFDTSRRTAKCVMREGRNAGRRITVVEAPGWSQNFTIKETPVRDKQEIVLSVSLCPSGPDALLLVIGVNDTFTEESRRAVQEHIELLGMRVWNHTLVLFTGKDQLIGENIEQYIESEGEALQWVVEKCGNRYHVLDNNTRDDGQVSDLLEMIEEMLAENDGCPFLIDRIKVKKQWKKEEEKRSKDQPPKMRDSGYLSWDSGYRSQPSAAKLRQDSMPKAFSKIQFADEDDIYFDPTKFIGRGSFGSVYKGSYEGKTVAVKKMSVGQCPVKTLEPIVSRRLDHPHIVKMIAVSKKEHDILIAYKYIRGANLHEIIHSPQCKIKLTEEDRMYVAYEIGQAVKYIHGENIIHQDIKPANILVSKRSKTAYLTDWGLANMKDSLAEFGISASGSLCGPRSAGTPLYEAPELLLDNERCTTMSDMWSLGLTFLEMFTGSLPWTVKNARGLTGLLLKKERPHGLNKLQPHLKKIVKPLVRYEPSSRMNATDLVKCLETDYEW